jgi:transcriptional regulator with XRE-family HTH domain
MAETTIETVHDWLPIWSARKAELKLTDEELEHRAGLSEKHFGKIMRGVRTPTVLTVSRINKVLGLKQVAVKADVIGDDRPL